METAREIYDFLVRNQASGVPQNEKEANARFLIEELFGISRNDWVVNKPIELTLEAYQKLKELPGRLLEQEPVQYITGHAWFMDLKIKVNPSVLIPRPETEELVMLISNRYKNQSKIDMLDVGTGSGCIALALKKNFPLANVTGIDKSTVALNLAIANSISLGLPVNFFPFDILNPMLNFSQQYDVIVSNPPYVLESETKMMQKNVLKFEPSEALFVDDDDPLLFYRMIAERSIRDLKRDGSLFFEINEQMGEKVMLLLKNLGYENIEVIKDIHGKQRIVAGIMK